VKKINLAFFNAFLGVVEILVIFFRFWGLNVYLKKRIWGNSSLAYFVFQAP